MARVGPNQDINDPTTIIQLAFEYQRVSDSFGVFLAISTEEDIDATGPPIIDISIPFRKLDGSIELLHATDIEKVSGKFIYDENLVSNAVINTYIFLAERFRDYWETLNSILSQINDWDTTNTSEIDPEGPIVVSIFGGTLTHGSLGGTLYNKQSVFYSPSDPLPTPTWTGVGPTNYNHITYPQLLSELPGINQTGDVDSWETIYWYSQFVDNTGSQRSAESQFGKTEDFFSIDKQYVQFFNDESFSIFVSLSIDMSATFTTNSSINISSWAEIGDRDNYPDPFLGQKSLLSSYLLQTQSVGVGGGAMSLSTSRTIEIPSGKSAFIGSRGAAFTGVWDSGTGLVNITLVMDGKELTLSEDLS